jgi:hypothetical protein
MIIRQNLSKRRSVNGFLKDFSVFYLANNLLFWGIIPIWRVDSTQKSHRSREIYFPLSIDYQSFSGK